MKLIKSYEWGGQPVLLTDDGLCYYVISPTTQFYGAYDNIEDADAAWFDQVAVIDGRFDEGD